MKVKFKKLHPDAKIPSRAHSTDAGYDLVATSRSVIPYPTHSVVYGTGLSIAIPEGYVGLIYPRSSVCKYDLMLYNSVGVCDSGFSGEIKLVFRDIHAGESIHTRKIYNVGDRIGQLIIMPLTDVEFEEAEELGESERGEGGWGSTGE